MPSTMPAKRKTHSPDVPPLENGDRLTQPEFHRRYEAYPDHVKIELIGGIVYMRNGGASPLRWPHANYHPKLSLALEVYASGTAGVELGDNPTTILGEENEPQPNLVLRILSEWGGQSRTDEEGYVIGAPELVAEIAHSTVAIDMHRKREEYQEAGVLEYLVLCVGEQTIHWFHFESGQEITPNRQGVYRSQVFPGLWVDGRALIARDSPRLLKVVRKGLASKPHAAFVKRLKATHRRLS